MLAPDFPIGFWKLGMPKPNLCRSSPKWRCQWTSLHFSLSLVTMFSAPFSSGPTFFPRLPFVVDLLEEVLLVVLHVPGQMQYQMGFGFPNFLPAFLDGSWAAYPWRFLSYASFLCLSFVKSSLFIYLTFLPLLLDVLLTRADYSWTWRKGSLKTNQLSCW